RKQCLVKPATRDRESCCGWGMSVANRIHIGPHAIEEKMHGQLGREAAVARNLMPVQVRNHQVFWSEHAFIHAGGSGEDAIVAQANRESALTSNVVTLLIQPAASNAQVMPMLRFGFRAAG